MAAYQDLIPYMDACPARIKQAKEEKRYTSNELADLSGVSVSVVTKLMSGAQPDPKLYNIAAICKVLDVSLDGLFGLSPPPESDSGLKDRVHELEVENTRQAGEIDKLDAVCELQTAQAVSKRISTSVLLCLCAVLSFALSAYIIMDATDALHGLIRNGVVSPPAIVVLATLALSFGTIIWSIIRSVRFKF